MENTKQDREILRKLATRYMEAAQLPVHREKLGLWKALNRGVNFGFYGDFYCLTFLAQLYS